MNDSVNIFFTDLKILFKISEFYICYSNVVVSIRVCKKCIVILVLVLDSNL